jgi:hypothetical protein
VLGRARSVSREDAIHFVCTDWRHIAELVTARKQVYGHLINIAVWTKPNANPGGSFYRSQHELIGVFRVGSAPHVTDIGLGRHGRSRSNVWRYPCVNASRAGHCSAHGHRKHPCLLAKLPRRISFRARMENQISI